MRYTRNFGFTLIEMTLSIALLALIAGISVPVYYTFQTKNELDITASSYALSLRRALTLAQAVDGDSSWGVRVTPANITVFKGASYAIRDSSFDEITSLNGSITVIGQTETVFAKFSSLPQTTGTTTFIVIGLGERHVSINEKGMINF